MLYDVPQVRNSQAIQNWNKLGPLKILDILQYSEINDAFAPGKFKLGEDVKVNNAGKNVKYIGQLSADNIQNGIGKRMYENGDI